MYQANHNYLIKLQQRRLVLVIVGFIFAVLIAYSKTQAFTYGLIRYDYDSTLGSVIAINENHRHKDIIFIKYRFSPSPDVNLEGEHQVDSFKDDFPYPIGSKLPVVYAKHFPEINVMESLYPDMKKAFYLFIVCFILMPVDVMFAIWYSVKIQKIKDNEEDHLF